ncbi:MAG: phytoene/squalene synthase family protein [Sulfolobales archaeon]
MIYDEAYEIFRKSSKTFYYASKLFPKRVRDDVALLYAFVRTIDDLVDVPEPKVDDFYRAWELTLRALEGERTGIWYIDAFADLSRRRGFEVEHIEAFMSSMEMDLYIREYQTFEELLRYIYGSAEVIGVFMAKIMGLSEDSYESAMKLGRAYQFINMVRDIGEDLKLGRVYMPKEDLERFGVECFCSSPEFREFIRFQVRRFFKMIRDAEHGYRYIPKRYLIPIKTASDLYKWAAKKIYRAPELVLRSGVKPSRLRSISYGLLNAVIIWI